MSNQRVARRSGTNLIELKAGNPDCQGQLQTDIKKFFFCHVLIKVHLTSISRCCIFDYGFNHLNRGKKPD